jgi:MFS family permease
MAVAVKQTPVAITDPAPVNRSRVILFSVLGGLALAIVWSFRFVDATIGDNIANNLLGYDAKETAITGSVMGALFAFVGGIAGTFTACNITAFSALAPMMGQRTSMSNRITEFLKPIGWLTLGMVVVAGLYGAIGAAIGTSIPQLSEARIGDPVTGFPVRLIQSSIVFGLIGLIFIYMGLAALKVVPNPLQRLYERHPRAQLVIMGGLIGGFLIGRPFPLFFKLFEYAAERHNAFYGGLVFILQAIGNIVILALLFLLLAVGTRGRLQTWLAAKPGRVAAVTAAAFIVGGVFFVSYWDVRLPSLFNVGWWPTMPWNNF